MNMTGTKVARETLNVSLILRMFDDSNGLRENHPLQRHSEQHSFSYRDGFIATVIKKEDFDSIKICEQKQGNAVVKWLIDGVQRLTEIKSYKNGAFKLGRTIERPIVAYQIPRKDEQDNVVIDEYGNEEYDICEFDLRGKGYDDLPKELQLAFDSCPIQVVKHLDCTEEEIAYHIRRYSHTKTMNAAQTSLTYTENRAVQIKQISTKNRFFVECGKYTPTEKKNGTLEKIIMESVMAAFHVENWNKTPSKIGQFINNNVPKSDFATLNEYFNRLLVFCEGKYQSIFNSKNTFIFVAAFHKFTELGLEDAKFEEFLDAFEKDLHSKVIDGVSFDILEEDRSTKSKSVIIGKIEHLQKLMNDFFGIVQEEVPEFDAYTYIKENINADVELGDMEVFAETLEDLTVNVDNTSKLLQEENKPSMIALVAYSFEKDIDLDDWIVAYFNKTKLYHKDQEKNYLHMVEDLNNFATT